MFGISGSFLFERREAQGRAEKKVQMEVSARAGAIEEDEERIAVMLLS